MESTVLQVNVRREVARTMETAERGRCTFFPPANGATASSSFLKKIHGSSRALDLLILPLGDMHGKLGTKGGILYFIFFTKYEKIRRMLLSILM